MTNYREEGWYKLSRHERIELRKQEIGSKFDRKEYSESFNQLFTFFLQSYRKGILTFCGSELQKIKGNYKEPNAKNIYRYYESGKFKDKVIRTRHPNIVKAVITGKKAWGLWIDQWSDGIADGIFTKKEILDEFRKHKIEIPDSLYTDFMNRIIDKTKERHEI